MKRLIRLLVVLGITLALVLALGGGAVFADEPHDSGGGIDQAEEAGAGAPVGSNIADEGFDNMSDTAGGSGIPHNPLCPFHPE
jgi:hypothetical protein